uniref:Myb-like protein AA n=1 Tax=Dermatophagoides pteronyssinus TaxID=6956 RepID=A0A6P6XNL7_DERPT|nr:myb-like protein AA [Dermatophagoides pteronyssinus]
MAILGNVLVMVAFKIDRQLQTISNYFLLSLAVADFLIGFISMPLSLIYIVVDGWPLGYSICDIWLAIDYLNSNASVLNLLLISFDRYFSVTRPLTYRAKRTTRRACIFIAFAWIVSALLWPPWIFAWPKIEGRRTVPEYQCYIPFLESNIWVTTITAIMAFWLPVTIMCILYWRIWRETENRYRELTSLVVISPATVNQPTATIAQTATTSITKLSTPTASSMVTGCITAGTNIGTISTTTTTTNSDSRGKIKLKTTSTNNSHHINIDENNKSNHNHQQQQQQQNNQNSSIKMPKRPIHLPNCPHSLIQRNKIRTNQTILSATTTTSQQEIDKDLQQQQQKSGTVVRRLPHDKPSSISIVGRTMSHTSIGQQSYIEPIPKIFSTHDYCDEIKLEDIQHTTEGLVCLKSPANIIEQDYENELFEINATTDLDGSKTSESRYLSFWSWIWNRLTFNHNNSKHKRCSSSGSSNNNKRKQLKKKYSIQELNSESGIMVQGDSMMNESTTTTTTTIKCPGCAYRLRRQRKRRLQKIKQIQQQKSLESEQTNINEQHPIMTIDKKSKKFINQSSLDNMSTTIQKQKQKQKQKHSEINYHIREMESINDGNQQSDSSIYTIVIKLQDPKDYNDNQRIMNESIKMLRSNRSKRSISSSIPSTTTTAAMIRQDSDQQQSMLDQVYIDENYDDSGDNDDDDDDDDEDDELDDDDDDDLKQQQQQHDTHLLQHQQSITSQATTTTTTATVTTTATPSSATFTRVRATFQPKSERKAAKTLSAILLAFIVTWTPYNVLGK